MKKKQTEDRTKENANWVTSKREVRFVIGSKSRKTVRKMLKAFQ